MLRQLKIELRIFTIALLAILGVGIGLNDIIAQPFNPGTPTTGNPANNDCAKFVVPGPSITTAGGPCASVTPSNVTGSSDTNVTVSLGGTPTGAALQPFAINMGWSGTLALARIAQGASGAIIIGQGASSPLYTAVSGDCTLVAAGTITCTKTNNVAFAASATTDTTNATNIASGTLNTARLPSPFTSGTRQGNTSAFVTFAGAAPTNGNIAKWDINGNVTDGGAGGSGTVTNVATNAGVTGGPVTNTGTIQADGNYSGNSNSNCTLAASVGSNLLTVALKDNAGNDPSASSPCFINYRNVTATTGSTSLVSQTAALSINTNATGATLGSVNATAFRLWVVAFNNAGTNVLALYNASTATGCRGIIEDIAQSSTAISGTATAAGTFYTPNGTTVTAKSIRILGYVEYNSSGLATAGTYASAPNFVHNMGPDVGQPCSRVQLRYASLVTGDSTSSTTFVAGANQQISITPISAANPIIVHYSSAANSPSTDSVVLVGSLSRGTTAATNLIGSLCQAGIVNTASANKGSCALDALDIPNTTSATIYDVQLKQGSAGTGTVSNSNGVFVVEEIKG